MQAKTTERPLSVLEISASGRRAASVSRALTRDLVAALEARHGRLDLKVRDLGEGLPFVDEQWIDATFTPAEARTPSQQAALALSDGLVDELLAADVLVIGAPMYNFSVPAKLKAWIDMVARAGRTFRYTENGPVGLVAGKKVYVVVATGGVPLGSAADFLSPYLEQVFGFLGLDDIEFIAADGMNGTPEASLDAARQRIAGLVHTAAPASRRVA